MFQCVCFKIFTIFFGACVSGSIHVILTGLSPVLALQDDSLVSCLPLLNNLLGTYKHHEVQIKRISENVPRNSLFPSLIPERVCLTVEAILKLEQCLFPFSDMLHISLSLGI